LIKKILPLILLSIVAMNAEARNGIYFTLDGGVATQSGLPSAADVGALSRDTTLFPSAIRAGVGYNHDLYDCFGFGLDIGMGRFGKKTYEFTNGSTQVYNETLEFLLQSQFHLKQWDLIGKVGGIRETQYVTGLNALDQETQIHPQAVLALGYNFNCHIAMIGSYTHVFSSQVSKNFQEMNNKTPALNEYMLGVRYTF
jgi:hypothetical protein